MKFSVWIYEWQFKNPFTFKEGVAYAGIRFCPTLLPSCHLKCSHEAAALGPNATGHRWWSRTRDRTRDTDDAGAAALPLYGPPLPSWARKDSQLQRGQTSVISDSVICINYNSDTEGS